MQNSPEKKLIDWPGKYVSVNWKLSESFWEPLSIFTLATMAEWLNRWT